MLTFLRRIDLIISWIEKHILMIAAFSITFLTFLSTVNRYFVGLTLGWIQEITIIFYMFLVFYGASNVEKDKAHLRISFLESILINKPMSFFHNLYVSLVSMSIVCLGIIFGSIMVLTTTRHTTYLSLPYSIVLASTFLLGFIFYAFRIFTNIYCVLTRNLNRKGLAEWI